MIKWVYVIRHSPSEYWVKMLKMNYKTIDSVQKFIKLEKQSNVYFLGLKDYAEYFNEKYHMNLIRNMDPVFIDESAFPLQKTNLLLLDDINKEIVKLQDTGEMTDICKKYIQDYNSCRI